MVIHRLGFKPETHLHDFAIWNNIYQGLYNLFPSYIHLLQISMIQLIILKYVHFLIPHSECPKL